MYSNCCGASPLYDIHSFDDEWYGLCGDCLDLIAKMKMTRMRVDYAR
jgi:hypothetical protein